MSSVGVKGIKMQELTIKTNNNIEILNITEEIENLFCKDDSGFCLIYCPHSTTAVAIGEDEVDLMKDYKRVVETILSPSRPFQHCGHGIPNAEAHIFSFLHGCSIVIPLEKGSLKRGKFQSVLFVEVDGPRERKVWIYKLAET